ncbi:hypothetical protein NEOLEDRAFT_1137145 [Neolentinus lepideus HHB14362 ss-1]|uniref:DUF6533 domain-containing protein n=1 Tax=Neolentinus lepideus HHB14362 ss-1 TaxID=1314782 RepID=A0A165QXX5_9AGAM|nr:hypothetical protein NEOLEDRAFT_1137145 [Neolentinus lepideus HHB14362 ss-1]
MYTRMLGIPVQSGDFVQTVRDIFRVNLVAAAGTTWLAYDIVTTIHLERALVWRSKQSLPTILYYLVRYFTMFSLIFNLAVETNSRVSTTFCEFWNWYRPFTGPEFSMALGEALFLMRICALYPQNWKVFALITLLYFSQITSATILIVLEVRSIQPIPISLYFPIPGCTTTSQRYVREGYTSWAIALLTSFVYFGLTMYKSIRSFHCLRRQSLWSTILEMRHLAPMYYIFARDGVLYFFVIAISNSLNMLFTVAYTDRAVEQVGIAGLMAAYGVMSSRLFLNLRYTALGTEELDHNEDEEISFTPHNHSR